MYAMQVMPATASDPGFGVKPAQSQTPAEYNRVGRDYLDALRGRYKGDLAAMWGAYNWGAGNVDQAIAKYGRDWWRHAPAETQNYIERNLSAMGR